MRKEDGVFVGGRRFSAYIIKMFGYDQIEGTVL
jgi:hypothetical protein